MYEIEIHKFIRQHHYWESLLTSAPYNLKITRDSGLIMFNYSHRESDFSLKLVRECRGLILREGTWEVVCRAMDKFMNAEEENSDLDKIDWATATVQEKIDGSLIRLFYDPEQDKWCVSTSGTIDAFKAELNVNAFNTFGDLFEFALKKTLAKKDIRISDFYTCLDKGSTYFFELTSPANRVVIPYEEYKVYFLGWRDNYWLGEEMRPDFSCCATVFPRPQLYALNTYGGVRRAANKLPFDEEGYVVCDDNFNRVKIKSPAYVRAHYFLTGNLATNRALMKIILNGEEDEVLAYCPNFANSLHSVHGKMVEFADKTMRIFNSLYDEYTQLEPDYRTRKNWAYMVGFHYKARAFMFWAFDRRESGEAAFFWDWADLYLNADKWLALLELDPTAIRT